MTFEIKEIELKTASDEIWESFDRFKREYHEAVTPEDDFTPTELIRQFIQRDNPMNVERHFIVIDSQNPTEICAVGGLTYETEKSPSYEEMKHACMFSLEVLPRFRLKGIARLALRWLLDVAKSSNKRVLITSTHEEDGMKTLSHIGAETALKGVTNRLYLKDVDWEMMSQWVKEGESRNPRSKLEFYEPVPDEIIEDYSRVYTETMNQQPLGTLDIGQMVFTPEVLRKMDEDMARVQGRHITAIIHEPNGDISALTEIMYIHGRPRRADQLLTGVQEDYRGQGKGKWLKAAMLFKLRELFPNVEYVHTGNATENAPMLSINNRMGFKVHRQDINAQITVEQLAAYLNGS